jgi:hypothetical protein
MRFFIIGCLSIGFLTSCFNDGFFDDGQISIRPSDEIDTVRFEVAGYQELYVESSLNVHVLFRPDDHYLDITANSNLLPYIVVDQRDNYLYLGLDRDINIRGDATMDVFIYIPDMNLVQASGATSVTFENELVTSYLDMELSGASNFRGHLVIQDLFLEISGASGVLTSGTSAYVVAEVSGASRFDDYSFVVDTLNLGLSGASSSTLTVQSVMNLNLTGASSFRYHGEGLINELNISGASSVRKTD